MDILKFKKKSILQQLRSSYQPKLPAALQGPVKVVEGAATQSAGDQEDIKKLFPNTYGLPELTVVKDDNATS
ncbi:MAG: diphosphate--fructose-6-phosphate 1-phosphotransferase, partial [Muribaculaceae bacterium]|nr:diphosphate--fructose-6-phosphate 1-phosphotransferase [Muribaculaceae bacterium]